MVRSAMAPDTIVAAVAQKTVWKIRKPSVGRPAGCSKNEMSPKCGAPINPAPSLPNIKPKPSNQNRIEPNMKSTKFLNKIFAVFLLRVKPASHRAKPGCIKNTNIAASSIHTVSNDILKSWIVIMVKICVCVVVS